MNTRLLLIALMPLLILGGCTKETTETKTTTVKQPYVAPNLAFWGSWKVINTDPSDTLKKFYFFDKSNNYGTTIRENASGIADVYYNIIHGTPNLLRYDGDPYRPYMIKGDTLVVYQENGPGLIDEQMVKVPDGSFSVEDYQKTLTVSRRAMFPRNFSVAQNSFGIDGDFLYVNHRRNSGGAYKFYKFNTLNGSLADSVDVPGGNWHAMHYKASGNKLYHTRYVGTYNMRQRTGLMGADANLSSNGISSVRAISTNGTSGTVYAYRNGTLYSGSEGGNFSSLYTFSGSYPSCNVYYKSDQFLGVYNGRLILFEISPTFKVLKQYKLPSGNYMNSVSTNGSDIWVHFWDNNRIVYARVSL